MPRACHRNKDPANLGTTSTPRLKDPSLRMSSETSTSVGRNRFVTGECSSSSYFQLSVCWIGNSDICSNIHWVKCSFDRGPLQIQVTIFIEIGEYCPNLSRPWQRSIRTRTWPVRDRAQATKGRLRHCGPCRRSSRSSQSIYFISRAQSMAICRILIEPWSIRTSFLLTKIGPSSGTSSSSGPSPTTPLSSTVTSRLS